MGLHLENLNTSDMKTLFIVGLSLVDASVKLPGRCPTLPLPVQDGFQENKSRFLGDWYTVGYLPFYWQPEDDQCPKVRYSALNTTECSVASESYGVPLLQCDTMFSSKHI